MKEKRNVLVVSTIASMLKQFCFQDIKMLLEVANVDVACNFDSGNTVSAEAIKEFVAELELLEIGVFNVSFSRSPLSLENFKAGKQLERVLEQRPYDLVHCHTPIASAIVRLLLGQKKGTRPKVVYTAHGFHFFRGGGLLGWLIYYPIEKLLAPTTDVLITINHEDYYRAAEGLKVRSVQLIPGVGITLSEKDWAEAQILEKRRELSVPDNAYLIASVGELNANKNHAAVIKALGSLKDRANIVYLICGQGILKKKLTSMVADLGLTGVVRFLGYRTDVVSILRASNLYIHPSFREGLGVAILEAMSVSLPVVCSSIRGCNELIVDGSGGVLINPRQPSEIARAIESLRQSPIKARELGQFNREKVKGFGREIVAAKMKSIYWNILSVGATDASE